MYLSVLFFFAAAAANDSNENARGRKPTKQETSPPLKRQKTETMSLTLNEPIDVFTRAQPLSFFLTKVHGISSEYNGAYTMSLRGIYRQANRKKDLHLFEVHKMYFYEMYINELSTGIISLTLQTFYQKAWGICKSHVR